MTMVRLTLALFLFLLPATCLADSGIPPEAKLEAERRGSFCEHVSGGGVQAADTGLFASAMQPPADDSHKWFISVVVSRNCSQCERLKRDFDASDALQPYVNTEDHRKSWAHYNVFRVEDQLQGWRFEKLALKSFPVVILQPPLDGRFGEATDYLPPIVGYDGNPQRLAVTIRERIRDHVEAYDAKTLAGPHREIYSQSQLGLFRQPHERNKNLDPPFTVLPREDEDQTEQPPFFLPNIQEIRVTDPVMTIVTMLAGLFGSGGLTVAIALGLAAFLLIREYRKSQGKQLLVSDEQIAVIEKLIEKLIAKQSGVQSSPRSANS